MRLLVLAGAVFVGVVTGIAGVVVHEKSWAWWALAVAAPLAAVVALPRGWPRIGFVAGVAAPLTLGIQVRPEGDYLIAATPRGYAFMGMTFVLVTVALATIPVRRRVAS